MTLATRFPVLMLDEPIEMPGDTVYVLKFGSETSLGNKNVGTERIVILFNGQPAGVVVEEDVVIAVIRCRNIHSSHRDRQILVWNS
mgnify:CR=1 FL=1